MTGSEWVVSPGLTDYAAAVTAMEARVAAIRAGEADERIWLVEHPPIYTAGVAARPEELIAARFPIHQTGRGGRFTYHGPGQRVVYPMLDLGRRGEDVRGYVGAVEGWIIAALGRFGLQARSIAGRTGVWVGEAKIAAIGVRVRRWVTYHGFAINVAPDLDHFAGIVPCGLVAPVTSLAALGVDATMAEVDAALEAGSPAFLNAIRTGGRSAAASSPAGNVLANTPY